MLYCAWDMHPQTEMRGDHMVGWCYSLTTEGFPKGVKSMVPTGFKYGYLPKGVKNMVLRGWGLFWMEEAVTGYESLLSSYT